MKIAHSKTGRAIHKLQDLETQRAAAAGELSDLDTGLALAAQLLDAFN